jgi:hypothetical protein
MKILIIGHGRHGKDTVAELFLEYGGFKYSSSSQAVAELFFSKYKNKYKYSSIEECYEDRINKRSEWYDFISDFNKEDPTRLCKYIQSKTDVYCGMRSDIELKACIKEKLFDFIIWVDRSKITPLEDPSSISIDSNYADVILDNNDSLEKLKNKVLIIAKILKRGTSTVPNNTIKESRAILIKELSTRKKFSSSQVNRIEKLFASYEDQILKNANFASEKLEVEYPIMVNKLEQLEALVLYFNKKYILSTDPSTLSKKDIVKNSEYFDIDSIIEEESREQELVGVLDPKAEEGLKSVEEVNIANFELNG